MSNVDLENLAARIAQVLQPRQEILEAYLFGSRARGESRPGSDTDIAVFLDRARAPNPPFGYAAELTALLMTGLGDGSVDLVILNDAPPLLYHRVLRDGIRVLARDLMTTTTREGRALSRYCDFAVQLKKIDATQADRLVTGAFGR